MMADYFREEALVSVERRSTHQSCERMHSTRNGRRLQQCQICSYLICILCFISYSYNSLCINVSVMCLLYNLLLLAVYTCAVCKGVDLTGLLGDIKEDWGSGDGSPPAGSRGVAPVGGLGRRSLPEAEAFL